MRATVVIGVLALAVSGGAGAAGAALVFLTEDNKMLTFDTASSAKAEAHMGQRVKVTGTTVNGVLKVDSIARIAMKK